MAIVGDKLKLTNYSYLLVPSTDVGNNTEILTNGEYSLIHNGSNRRWDEKVIDAFDIDWNPYELHFSDDHINDPIIKLQSTDDLIHAIEKGMSYASHSYSATYAYHSTYSIWTDVAYYVDKIEIEGAESLSNLITIENIDYNCDPYTYEMKISYTYNYKTYSHY